MAEKDQKLAQPKKPKSRPKRRAEQLKTQAARNGAALRGPVPAKIRYNLQGLLESGFNDAERLEVIRALVRKAVLGEMDAIKLLMAYTFGQPKQSVEVAAQAQVMVRYVDDWRAPGPVPQVDAEGKVIDAITEGVGQALLASSNE